MKFRKSLACIAFLFVVGCEASTDLYLYREGGTVSRADNDFFECELAAARAVPQDTRVETTPTFTTPVQTNCYNTVYGVQCNTTGGQVYGGQTYTYDANSDLRSSFLARCLASRGYSVAEFPVCEATGLPASFRERLAGRLRPPAEGACYLPITERAGNIIYASERGG